MSKETSTLDWSFYSRQVGPNVFAAMKALTLPFENRMRPVAVSEDPVNIAYNRAPLERTLTAEGVRIIPWMRRGC